MKVNSPFAWGIIKVSKGSDIANLASLEVLARVRLPVKFCAINPVIGNFVRKNHITLLHITVIV